MILSYYRELYLLFRLYLLNNGYYAYLDQAITIDLISKFAVSINDINESSDIREINLPIFLACQSNKRLDIFFKKTLLFMLREDSSIRVNGKLLEHLQKIYSNQEFNLFFTADSFFDHINITPLIKELGIDKFIQNLKIYYFNRNFFTKRFESQHINTQVFTKLDELDLNRYIDLALEAVFPVSKKNLANLELINHD